MRTQINSTGSPNLDQKSTSSSEFLAIGLNPGLTNPPDSPWPEALNFLKHKTWMFNPLLIFFDVIQDIYSFIHTLNVHWALFYVFMYWH